MIATVVLAAELAGTLDFSDTSSVRARATPVGAVGVQSTGLDLTTSPSARLGMSDRRWAYTLSYVPALTLPDIQVGFAPQLFHFGSAAIAWHDRTATLTLTQTGTYGWLNSAFLYQAPVTPGQTAVLQPAPVAKTIQLGSSNTDFGAGLRVSRDVRLAVSAGYGVSGGLDTDSRLALPEQYGPRAAASFTYALSRRDSLGTSASAWDTTTLAQCLPPLSVSESQAPRQYAILGAQVIEAQPCHVRSSAILLQETLARRLSAVARASLGAGVGVDRTYAYVEQWSVYPSAFASFSYRFGPRGRSGVTALAQLAPVTDVRTGLSSERLQISALLTNILTASITMHAGIDVLQTVPTDAPFAVSMVMGSVDAAFRLSRLAAVTIGQQGLWQNQPGYGTLVSVFSYVALTVRASEIRF